MATIQCVLVKVGDVTSFAEEAPRHRIIIDQHSDSEWWLIDCPAQFTRLGPPAFSQDLSLALKTTVIALFAQTTASVEHLQHWESGELKRELIYELESGGWVRQEGPSQIWEASYFFGEDEGVNDGENWPSALPDDVSDEDLERYREAKNKGDPSKIMDILSEGDLVRLCQFYGASLERPHARHSPPANWKPRVIVLLFVAILITAFVLGALAKV